MDGFRALAARDDIDALLYLADQWYGATPILAACEHGKSIYSAISLPFDPAEAGMLRRRVEESGIAFADDADAQLHAGSSTASAASSRSRCRPLSAMSLRHQAPGQRISFTPV